MMMWHIIDTFFYPDFDLREGPTCHHLDPHFSSWTIYRTCCVRARPFRPPPRSSSKLAVEEAARSWPTAPTRRPPRRRACSPAAPARHSRRVAVRVLDGRTSPCSSSPDTYVGRTAEPRARPCHAWHGVEQEQQQPWRQASSTSSAVVLLPSATCTAGMRMAPLRRGRPGLAEEATRRRVS